MNVKKISYFGVGDTLDRMGEPTLEQVYSKLWSKHYSGISCNYQINLIV